jgi:hypothetical protein
LLGTGTVGEGEDADAVDDDDDAEDPESVGEDALLGLGILD